MKISKFSYSIIAFTLLSAGLLQAMGSWQVTGRHDDPEDVAWHEESLSELRKEVGEGWQSIREADRTGRKITMICNCVWITYAAVGLYYYRNELKGFASRLLTSIFESMNRFKFRNSSR